jgi:pyruvate formate lyase activating enzyme
MISGVVFHIKRYAVHDGPGIRTTIFLKGCASRCWWCHNPESQESEPELVNKINKLNGIDLQESELIGKTMTAHEVLNEIDKDILFFDESGGGVTFSGGEPLMQPEFLSQLLILCKKKSIHTAIDTTGYATLEVFQGIASHVDLFLYDIKFIDDVMHQKYTGVSNCEILQNLKFLINSEKKVILRFPVVPDITDTEQNIYQIKAFISEVKKGSQDVDLLPYHTIANAKYKRLCKENKMLGIREPSPARLNELKKEFEQLGLNVKIGG